MTDSDDKRDFWKDAKARKLWDEIVPGEKRTTLPYHVTLEAIQDYCRSVGDLHPMYFDEEYARKSPFKGLVAPPGIHSLLIFACLPMDDWMRTPGHINAGQTWNYENPVRPGDTITLETRAIDKFIKKDRLFVIHHNMFFNQQGQVTCTGRGWSIRPA
jgi:acyl dehydratase